MAREFQNQKQSLEQQRENMIEKAEAFRKQGLYHAAATYYEKAAELSRYIGEKDRMQIYMATAKKMELASQQGKDNRQRDLILAGEEKARVEKIRSTILDLGTKYPRLLVAEIAEKCGVDDEDLVIEKVQDMIANNQIAAEYFERTQTIVFNQQVNVQDKDKFIAELEKAFTTWGKEGKKT